MSHCTTRSISLVGRYRPVAKLPNTSTYHTTHTHTDTDRETQQYIDKHTVHIIITSNMELHLTTDQLHVSNISILITQCYNHQPPHVQFLPRDATNSTVLPWQIVPPSTTLRCCDHICWSTSKIILQLITIGS